MRLIFFILSMWIFDVSGQLIVTGSKPYQSPVTGSTWSEIRLDLRGAGTSSGTTGYNTLAGSPHSSVLSTSLNDINGTSTGVSISTVATANWNAYSGCSCSTNDAVSGITGGTALGTGASTGVYSSIMFTYGTATPARYDATKWQFLLSGLNPSTTYTIRLVGSDGSLGFTARWVARVVGLTSPTAVEVDGNQTSVTNYAEFTLQPAADGTIKIWWNTSTTNSGDVSPMCGIKITK